MAICFNKNTWVWQTTDTPENLPSPADWVIDPTYSDEAACKEVGPANWIYTGSVISPKPAQDIIDSELASIRMEVWRKIQVERERRSAGGVQVGAYWFHSDSASRIQQLGLVMFGAGMPGNIMWKTMSGAFTLMTPTLALQIFGAVAASDMAIFAVAEGHRSAVMASSDPLSYNYLTGWPLIYGE